MCGLLKTSARQVRHQQLSRRPTLRQSLGPGRHSWGQYRFLDSSYLGPCLSPTPSRLVSTRAVLSHKSSPASQPWVGLMLAGTFSLQSYPCEPSQRRRHTVNMLNIYQGQQGSDWCRFNRFGWCARALAGKPGVGNCRCQYDRRPCWKLCTVLWNLHRAIVCHKDCIHVGQHAVLRDAGPGIRESLLWY